MQMLGPLRGVQAGDWRACRSTQAIMAFVNSQDYQLVDFCRFFCEAICQFTVFCAFKSSILLCIRPYFRNSCWPF